MAEETALEMRQAGQPVRGFKSLHLRLTNRILSAIIHFVADKVAIITII